MKDYYAEIDKCLSRHEQGKFTTHSMEWCTDRVAWCWKWRKITKEQMNNLADRICNIYDNNLSANFW